MLNSFKNGRRPFIFTTLLVHTTTQQCPLKIFSSTSVNFHLPIPLLLFNKIILTIPNNTPFLYTSSIFKPSQNLHQKYFLYLSHLLNSGCFKGAGSYWFLWGMTLFQSLPVLTVITGLTITVFVSLRLRKLVYCR